MRHRLVLAIGVAAALVAGTGLVLLERDDTVAVVIDPGDRGVYAPTLDPDDFVDEIDNRYLPLRQGSRWVYESLDAGERVEVVVTGERRTILGIGAVVVRDTVTVDGRVVEDTYDWFAQDRAGNVWYLGEDSKEYDEDGRIDPAGSWEAGFDGARPGIVMPAVPTVGDAYRQEFYPGEAEDLAEVIALDESATVRAGTFAGLVVTKEWTPLEPDVVESKYYAPGVGLVLEHALEGGSERLELIQHITG